MSLEGERFTAEVSRLKAEGEGLRTDLAAEATARQKAADALTATEKQLKAAQVARKEAHESEKKWRLELVDHQGRGAGLEEAAAAAAAAADGKAKEAGALNATVLSLNASLRARGAARRAGAPAVRRGRGAGAGGGGGEGRAGQGVPRRGRRRSRRRRARRPSARRASRRSGRTSRSCAAAAKEAKEWAAKYDTQKRKADEAAAEAEASRAAAIGKEEADGAARACAEGRQDVSDRVARLEAAQERAQAQLKQLAASEQAALRKEGATAEAARLSEEKLKACGAERKALSSRIAQLEAEAAALSEAKQSCTEELGAIRRARGPPRRGRRRRRALGQDGPVASRAGAERLRDTACARVARRARRLGCRQGGQGLLQRVRPPLRKGEGAAEPRRHPHFGAGPVLPVCAACPAAAARSVADAPDGAEGQARRTGCARAQGKPAGAAAAPRKHTAGPRCSWSQERRRPRAG